MTGLRNESPMSLRRLVAAALILVMLVLAAPRPAQAQFGAAIVIAAANAVTALINRTIGPLLDAANGLLGRINGFVQQLSDLWQQVVWPVNLINQARAMVAQMIGIFRPILAAVRNVNVLSATLPNPTSLEAVIRNRATGDFAQMEQAFRNTYRPLPASNAIHPVDRGLIDMDDAMAMGTLKRLKASDQIVERMVQSAETIEDEAAIVAPGTAPYLVGSGLAAAIQSEAMMQKMLAAELRQEAAALAHTNSARKRAAVFATEMRDNVRRAFR